MKNLTTNQRGSQVNCPQKTLVNAFHHQYVMDERNSQMLKEKGMESIGHAETNIPQGADAICKNVTISKQNKKKNLQKIVPMKRTMNKMRPLIQTQKKICHEFLW